MTLYNGVTLKL